MTDPRYRAAYVRQWPRVFDRDEQIAGCKDIETAERIAAALNEMEERDENAHDRR